jgi:calcineurin-like phosphoesterase family protein
MYFLISDEHYGHEKVIGYCNRPFGSVEEMNEIKPIKYNNWGLTNASPR